MLKQIGRAFLSFDVGWLDKPRPGAPARVLTPDDTETFFQAAEQRKPPVVKDARWISDQLKQSNPVRYARLRRDFGWMQKRMKKMGLNPEDARFLL